MVVDCDVVHQGASSLPELGLRCEEASARTRSGGHHFLFQYPNDVQHIPSVVGVLPGIDIRADGGYIKAHPSEGYQWKLALGHLKDLPTLSGDVKHMVCGVTRSARSPNIPSGRPFTKNWSRWRSMMSGVTEGRRNQAAARLAGALLRRGLDKDRSIGIMKLWNSENKPPMDDVEVVTVYESVLRTHLGRAGRQQSSDAP